VCVCMCICMCVRACVCVHVCVYINWILNPKTLEQCFRITLSPSLGVCVCVCVCVDATKKILHSIVPKPPTQPAQMQIGCLAPASLWIFLRGIISTRGWMSFQNSLTRLCSMLWTQVCVYVCVCVCVCVCKFVCVCVCVCVCVFIDFSLVHAYAWTCIQRMYSCVHAQTHTFVWIFVCIRVYTRTTTCTCMNICVFTCLPVY